MATMQVTKIRMKSAAKTKACKTNHQAQGLVRLEPPQGQYGHGGRHGPWNCPGTWTRQVRQRFPCLVCIKFAYFVVYMAPNHGSKPHAWFGRFGKLYAWFGLIALCLLFVKKISCEENFLENLLVLKHSNQLQYLIKPCKLCEKFRQIYTVCLDNE